LYWCACLGACAGSTDPRDPGDAALAGRSGGAVASQLGSAGRGGQGAAASGGGSAGRAAISGATAGTGQAGGAARVAIGQAGTAANGVGANTAGQAAAGRSAAGSGYVSAGAGGSSSVLPPLDCGPKGVAIENAGPPKNRVNYVIVGDGYTEADLDTTYLQHVQTAMKKRFSDVIGQPYGRYRKFVNICAIKLASPNGPIGKGATALDCTGDDQSRLAECSTSKVNMAISANLPASFEVDWKAVVLNNNRWWNTGAVIMLWSGAHKDAAGAALHEGGHGFHQLADEYGGTNSGCTKEYNEVNSTADSSKSAGKWDLWLDYDQAGATGKQSIVSGSRYCDSGQYRPSQNSMMNQLFGDNPNTAYNAVSREKMAMDIYRAVVPIDATLPPAGDVAPGSMLEVTVIDPAVINVDWSVDGTVVAANGGERFDLSAQQLAAGMHTISARAYDNAGMELVRYKTGTQFGRMNWARSQQTVSWTVSVP